MISVGRFELKMVDNKELMTGYEQRLVEGWKKSAADLLKDQKMLSSALKVALGAETVKQLESGEYINIPIVYDLLIELLAYWKEHPEKIDLKTLSAVLGETKQEVSIEARKGADELFGDIVNKTK